MPESGTAANREKLIRALRQRINSGSEPVEDVARSAKVRLNAVQDVLTVQSGRVSFDNLAALVTYLFPGFILRDDFRMLIEQNDTTIKTMATAMPKRFSKAG